jgi:hypothetical protein
VPLALHCVTFGACTLDEIEKLAALTSLKVPPPHARSLSHALSHPQNTTPAVSVLSQHRRDFQKPRLRPSQLPFMRAMPPLNPKPHSHASSQPCCISCYLIQICDAAADTRTAQPIVCAWFAMSPFVCVQVLRVLPHLGTLDGERLKVGGGGVAAFEGAGKLLPLSPPPSPPPPPCIPLLSLLFAIFLFLTAHSSGSKSEANFPVPESQAWLTGFKWDDCFDGLLPSASTCVRCGDFDIGAADVDGVMKKHDAEFAKVFARILRRRHTHNRHRKAACLRASLLQPTSAAAA